MSWTQFRMYAIIDNQYYNDENSIQVTVMQIVEGKRTPHTHINFLCRHLFARKLRIRPVCDNFGEQQTRRRALFVYTCQRQKHVMLCPAQHTPPAYLN